uniref:Uncharacterized protein n=1 Tax=Panagrolaimus superbus TaxID=310955 RepID=A0A914Y359_9BILA
MISTISSSSAAINSVQEQLSLSPSSTSAAPILIFTTPSSSISTQQQEHQNVITAECDTTVSPASSQSTSTLSNNNTQDYDFLNEWNWQQSHQHQHHQQQHHHQQESSEIDEESEEQELSTAGIPTFSVIRQPEEQHRARYLSEGSRGAIKDRSGTSNCTIQISGFYRPTRVELFAATGSGQIIPHQLYRLIPVSGKSANTTPCRKMCAHDGIECLEITLRPESSMTAV